jgi:hypothetical protein
LPVWVYARRVGVNPALQSRFAGHIARREPRTVFAVEEFMRADDDGDVFLVGAGFARAISPTMPLLQDLAERVIDALDGATRIPPEVEAMMRENFAHALSYLEQRKPWSTEADNLRHRALFLDISNTIARDLDATVERACRSLGSQAPDWLRRLLRHWHERQCTILTVNYDTLIESLAGTMELAGDERVRAHDIYPLVLTDAGLRSGSAGPAQRRESFQLLKLHGSTNWYYSGRAESHGEAIYFVPPLGCGEIDQRERHEHAQRLRAVADKYPFLVPPIYDKSPLLTHETIRALWFEAGAALKQARRLVCMGYSLPASDLTMMHFLRTTCRRGARISLVNQGPEALKNFQVLFRHAGIDVEQCTTGENCVPDFVAQLGPA